ncbi:MAG: iron chelate uptake ABC transporter family permease subunit, partial [Neisseria sp.]|nr:iron chelate uptake ABC transporter family permease subunit [Neisseria sp.]
AALLTGAAVSMAGIIGFLGMMIPNIVAHSIGGRRSKMMLLSAWVGSVFLLSVDALARWLTYPIDVPVGIVIALLGGPFFMWLFLRPLRRA